MILSDPHDHTGPLLVPVDSMFRDAGFRWNMEAYAWCRTHRDVPLRATMIEAVRPVQVCYTLSDVLAAYDPRCSDHVFGQVGRELDSYMRQPVGFVVVPKGAADLPRLFR